MSLPRSASNSGFYVTSVVHLSQTQSGDALFPDQKWCTSRIPYSKFTKQYLAHQMQPATSRTSFKNMGNTSVFFNPMKIHHSPMRSLVIISASKQEYISNREPDHAKELWEVLGQDSVSI